MKKNLFSLVIFLFVLNHLTLSAQNQSIAPLFGVEEAEGIFFAINQHNGEQYFIEAALEVDIYEKRMAYNHEGNQIYIINTNPLDPNETILYTYVFPVSHLEAIEVYTDTLSILLNDIVYSDVNDSLYGVTVNGGVFYAMGPLATLAPNAYNYNQSEIEPASLNIAIDNDAIYVSGVVLGNEDVISVDRVDVNFSTQTSTIQYDGFQSIMSFTVPNNSSGFYAVVEDTFDQFSVVYINDVLEMNEVAVLPSCEDCTAESYQYPKSGLTFDFSNNHLIAVQEKTISGTTSRSLLTIDILTGDLVAELPLTDNYRNLVYMQVEENYVFPGDANHDGLVDIKDALAIGLQHSTTTNLRQNPVPQWVGQNATATSQTFVSGADVKHADCNGDGQINTLDTILIARNYNSTHNAVEPLPMSSGDCDVPIYLILEDSVIYEDKIELSIGLGTDVDLATDVYGVAFTVVYDTTYIEASTIETQGLDSWFGFVNNDHFKMAVDDYDNGEVSMAVVGIDHQDRSGGGGIIKSIWGVEGEVIPIAQPVDISFGIRDVYLIRHDETVIDVCDIDTTFTITRKATGVRDVDNKFFSLYPHPAKDKVKISTNESIQKVTVISMSGAVLREYHEVQEEISLEGLASGMYLLKVATKNNVGVQKLLVEANR